MHNHSQTIDVTCLCQITTYIAVVHMVYNETNIASFRCRAVMVNTEDTPVLYVQQVFIAPLSSHDNRSYSQELFTVDWRSVETCCFSHWLENDVYSVRFCIVVIMCNR